MDTAVSEAGSGSHVFTCKGVGERRQVRKYMGRGGRCTEEKEVGNGVLEQGTGESGKVSLRR